MATGNEMFEDIELGSLTQTPCSPREPEDPFFRGILINAPSRVTFKRGDQIGPGGAFAAIPICGYYMFDVADPPRYLPGPLEAMRLVATDRSRHITLSGPLVASLPIVDPETPPPRPNVTKQDFKVAAGGYFNANLAECIAIPPIAASYDVHVELGHEDSGDLVRFNAVTIEVIQR